MNKDNIITCEGCKPVTREVKLFIEGELIKINDNGLIDLFDTLYK